MRNIQVNFGDIFPETSKSSAFWDIGVPSHLKWLPFFSPDEPGESDSTSLWTPYLSPTRPLAASSPYEMTLL